MWATDPVAAVSYEESDIGTPPLAGLVPSGDGSDPGMFDVEAQSGTISALPRRNGNFTFFLLAEDEAGYAGTMGLPPQLDQVVVAKWHFSVVGKPNFVVDAYSRVDAAALPELASSDDPFITRSKVGSIDCTVGTVYHIAPVDNAALKFSHASGGDDAVIRYTIRNPPPGFFIEPSSGEVQANPQAISAGRTFVSTLLAVDPHGREAPLEEMTFTIVAKSQFVPVFKTDRTVLSRSVDLDDYVDPTSPERPFLVGSSYKIATFVLDLNATKVSAGSRDAITYTLSPDAPESFCVQATSGDISGTFPTAGNYSFSVLAVDQAGETSVAEHLNIVVDPMPVFNIAVGTLRVRSGPGYTVPSSDPSGSSPPFYIGESYRFSPLALLENQTMVSSGTFEQITFTLVADDGWFVSAQTGEIFGQFGSLGNHTLTLYAVDHAGKMAVVEATTFNVQPRPVFMAAAADSTAALSWETVGLPLQNRPFHEPSRWCCPLQTCLSTQLLAIFRK